MLKLRRLATAFCSLTILLSMSACRDSAVVECIVYDYVRANQTDMDKSLFDDMTEREHDDLLHDLEKDEASERENDEEEANPVFSSEDEPDTEETAGEPNYDEASERTEAAGADNVSANDADASGGESETEDGEQSGGTDNAGLSDEAEGEAGTSGGQSTRTVTDDFGSVYEVPENVSSMAAVGDAAVAVLMLGGADCLAAANEELTENELAVSVFPELADIPALWSGDGSKILGSAELQHLIALHPDVCIELSGSSMLSNAQVEQLEAEGICCVTLPAPSSVENVKLIVRLLGEILGDHTDTGGYNSVSIAAEYTAWVDETLAAVSEATASGGSYTMYIDGWDKDAYYSIAQASSCYGYGAAVVNNANMTSCKAVSNFLSQTSVTNVTSLGSFSRTETVYFTPINSNYSTVNVSGVAADRLTSLTLLELGSAEGLGADDSFTKIIAGSQAVRDGIESSTLWHNFGEVTSGNGNFIGFGFLDDYGEIVRSSVQGEYTVLVNPRGVCSWTAGSVESVLESVWAAYAIGGSYTEEDMEDIILDFYSTFYSYELSDGELEAVLAGE